MQLVLKVIAGLISLLNVFCEVQNLGELAPVVELDRGVCDGVVLESHEMKVQHWWKVLKQNTFLGVLQKEIRKVFHFRYSMKPCILP